LATDVHHSAKSDIGLKRQHNEDRVLADSALKLYAVCDGMGGGNAGEIASTMAIETIDAHVRNGSQNPDLPFVGQPDPNLTATTNRLASAIRAANEAIHRASWTNPAYAGMGTTVVAVQLTDHLLSIANVGDSRLYVLRRGTIQQLTVDHSWVAEQVQQGLLTEAEAERSPRRNIVTRALGVESSVEVDVMEFPVQNGDCFLLCSDGLTRGVRAADILQASVQHPQLDELADRLISMANQAGGEDNTTVLLLTIPQTESEGLWQRMAQRWLKAS